MEKEYLVYLNKKINYWSTRYDLSKDVNDRKERDRYINMLEVYFGKIRSKPVQLEIQFID